MRKTLILGILIGALGFVAAAWAYDYRGDLTGRSWLVYATDTAATVTATKGVIGGFTHFVSGIVAHCDGATTTTVVLELKNGSTTVVLSIELVLGDQATHTVPAILAFDPPLRMTRGNSANAVLATCGAGNDGHVTMYGYTERGGLS